MKINWIKHVEANLEAVRQKKPLVHNITNFVVMNSSANILLAIGAQPVMAHAINEVEDMVSIANSLVLNIGTLSNELVEAMILAGKKANKLGVPVIFDPVGAGATRLRTEKSMEILREVKLAVIRGNASEINSIAGSDGARGVDSIHDVDKMVDFALDISQRYNCIIGISGKRDLITDGTRIVRVSNGNPIMTRVTGIGCGLTATVGAFIGANEDPLTAAVSAFGYYAIAGDLAFQETPYPGSFLAKFIDALSYIENKNLNKLKIDEI
ncbi:hydroxyethylthiazole kinase [bacterium]|nr:hydroxyethylthiazole kinase [bacterium]